ncbi:expressed unknown protein [Seminavis robusta]|uniref:Uncharacterized protein n=1 Tax=Seminavis robusta TaxID=568900 RepID=A0A9N8E5E1_9STRA|nr:expressed unknown protein [Seminavis robusta]|eukprot:Sro636_g179310.1 n/a (156) ;mRNA; r:34780-35247
MFLACKNHKQHMKLKRTNLTGHSKQIEATMNCTQTIECARGFEPGACASLFPEESSKLFKAAEIHGYCGISRGGKDGVYNILKESKKRDIRGDRKLFAVYERLREQRGASLPEGGIPIKVVAHVPSGERLVGVFYPKDQRIVLLGLGDYDGKILV